MAELSCISRLYYLTRNFAHLIKNKKLTESKCKNLFDQDLSDVGTSSFVVANCLVSQRLAERALYTKFQSSFLTPEYLLPSQGFPVLDPTYSLPQQSQY